MFHDVRGPLVKQLTDSEQPRRYWRGDDEGGGVWLFESVEGDGGEQWVIRQVEIDPHREVHKYWWRHLDDEHGFLSDQPLEIWDSMAELPAEAFESIWATTVCACES